MVENETIEEIVEETPAEEIVEAEVAPEEGEETEIDE